MITATLNTAFTANLGYSLADLKGQNFSVLFNQRDKEKTSPAWKGKP